ncbi:lipopolysaccharide-induced tumor necrosis factor-alpha factor [Brachionus plicatilis]|uniref:Lipopolysaccharide-induced tumor necrosis factor-alpha factor n=1 Tax=Brachionus plicatilis TaxID=10195 RepID=A0A3M7S4K8_BRAPC|nr:lipopolysaccharide-induced tumor necrosis factor-alpha factor [Brachionus plicatilis]
MEKNQIPSYPVQPPPYPSQPMQYPSNVVIQPVINQRNFLGKDPSYITCPSCRAQVLTNISHETGLGTWLIAGGICFVGCALGCCLIPFCVDSCKDVKHYCPSCNVLIGTRELLS